MRTMGYYTASKWPNSKDHQLMEWRSSVTRHRQCSPSGPRDSANILRFRQPRDSGGNYSYIILVFVACHSVSLGVRGSPRESPTKTSPLTDQPRVSLGSARWDVRYAWCHAVLRRGCVFSKNHRQLDKNYCTKQQGRGFFFSGLTSSGQLLCDCYPGVGVGAGCLASV